MKTKRFIRICVGLILLMALPLCAQVGNTPAAATGFGSNNGQDQTQSQSSDPMLTSPVVSGQTYATTPISEERSNYLRGGMSFTSTYGNNAVATTNGQPINQMSYSVAPTMALDETTSRLHFGLSYSPGFTFYQQTSYLNATNQNASINLRYRLSPHVTLTANDGVQKTSSVFSQPDFPSSGAVSGGAQGANFSVIAPAAEILMNSGNISLNYQFSRNGMIGVSGTFSTLHYPNPTQVSGLSDSGSQGGSVFYSLRVSPRHYLGATYQYQRLTSSQTTGLNETQTDAILMFYTLYPSSHFSISFFGGPQYSDTIQPPIAPLNLPLPAIRAWTPSVGGSLGWQGHLHSFAMSYSHVISGGSGLFGAVHMDSASTSLRQQFTRTIGGSVTGSYVENDVIGSILAGAYSGHSLSGTVSVQKQFHQHVSLQLGYTRLHQDYSDVPVLSQTPNTNSEFVSLSYQFSRPLGR